jgi:hypothetical protein
MAAAHPLAPYLSPEEREQRLAELAGRAGGQTMTYGHSVGGRPLRAAILPGSSSDLPRVLCTANIHGVELVASAVALALAEEAGRPGTGAHALRDRAELWVVPSLNPDGYARTWEREGCGRVAELRTNDRWVDLNRNFPLPAGSRRSSVPWAGSSRCGATTYCGPQPLSEPESRALEALLDRQAFHASANIHSFMGTFIPARVRDKPTYQRYKHLARAFREAQTRWHYPRLASRWLDVYTGELEDHQHHSLGCWAACIECFSVGASFRQHLRPPRLFWRFNPRDPAPWVENDVAGVVGFLGAALDLPRVAEDQPPAG